MRLDAGVRRPAPNHQTASASARCSVSSEAPQPLPEQRWQERLLAGRYALQEKLGAGAMGTVYRALDTKLGRFVAIKTLPQQSVSDPDAVARFRGEARALARLSHPNIVQAHDTGEDQGQHFLIMEYVEGTNLARLLKDEGPVAPAMAADYIHMDALGLENDPE